MSGVSQALVGLAVYAHGSTSVEIGVSVSVSVSIIASVRSELDI